MTDEVTDTDASGPFGDRDLAPPKPIILIASVGGSPEPVASAISQVNPGFVMFVATDDTPGHPGSAGLVPRVLELADRRDLPHEIIKTDTDDPQQTFLQLRERVRRLRSQNAGRILFDYTGGTKSMTAALFLVAVAEGLEPQFMVGERPDTQKVKSGTERATLVPIRWLVAERQELSLRRAWQSFGYRECASGIETMLKELGEPVAAARDAERRMRALGEVSRAFDLWDSFQHARCKELLKRAKTQRSLDKLTPWIELAESCVRSEPARLLDLVRNAERCAARGRYDDAVARLYRLVEWTAQWRLKAKHGIDSSNVNWSNFTDEELCTAGLEDQKARSSTHRKPNLGGLERTLSALRAKEPNGPLAQWLSAVDPKTRKTGEHVLLRDLIPLRNKSILAHGEAPVTKRAWEQWSRLYKLWCEYVLFPLLRDAGEPAELPPQLPDDPVQLGL